jgi:hypothetical protein
VVTHPIGTTQAASPCDQRAEIQNLGTTPYTLVAELSPAPAGWGFFSGQRKRQHELVISRHSEAGHALPSRNFIVVFLIFSFRVWGHLGRALDTTRIRWEP